MELFTSIDWQNLLTTELLWKVVRVVSIVIIGLIISLILSRVVEKVFVRRFSRQYRLLIRKVISYVGIVILITIVLSELGVDLTALLGAAGVLGLAVGIASQKSLGNMISGFFLVSEQSFSIGDVVKVGDKTGIVHSVDLLSIKLKTFDNLLIRIPNDTLMSSELTNITKFPVRRIDFTVSISYRDDLELVEQVLRKIAKQELLCLEEPGPLILFTAFADSGIEFLFGVWADKKDFLAVKNSVFKAIKREFEEADITIPYPHLTLYAEPGGFPLRSVIADTPLDPVDGSTT